ncbi:hypothetical protein [Anatilimnocola aggregata]|nr:hypothetical protein [Anatilimnocola aggregata]
MPRLRYSFPEAQAEAVRLATEYIRQQPKMEGARLGAQPNKVAPKSATSKIPVMWVVVVVFHPPDVVMDGGDLVLDVNIETKEVRPWR